MAFYKKLNFWEEYTPLHRNHENKSNFVTEFLALLDNNCKKNLGQSLSLKLLSEAHTSIQTLYYRCQKYGFAYAGLLDLSMMLQKVALFCKSGEVSQSRQLHFSALALFKCSLQIV